MSLGRRPSVPRMRGRLEPLSIPTVTPFAPGNVPNRLSKVLFSLTTNTTCLIGVRVVNALAFTTRGVSGASVGVAEMFGWPGGVPEARPVQADNTRSATATHAEDCGRTCVPLRRVAETMFHSSPHVAARSIASCRSVFEIQGDGSITWQMYAPLGSAWDAGGIGEGQAIMGVCFTIRSGGGGSTVMPELKPLYVNP